MCASGVVEGVAVTARVVAVGRELVGELSRVHGGVRAEIR